MTLVVANVLDQELCNFNLCSVRISSLASLSEFAADRFIGSIFLINRSMSALAALYVF